MNHFGTTKSPPLSAGSLSQKGENEKQPKCKGNPHPF